MLGEGGVLLALLEDMLAEEGIEPYGHGRMPDFPGKVFLGDEDHPVEDLGGGAVGVLVGVEVELFELQAGHEEFVSAQVADDKLVGRYLTAPEVAFAVPAEKVTGVDVDEGGDLVRGGRPAAGAGQLVDGLFAVVIVHQQTAAAVEPAGTDIVAVQGFVEHQVGVPASRHRVGLVVVEGEAVGEELPPFKALLCLGGGPSHEEVHLLGLALHGFQDKAVRGVGQYHGVTRLRVARRCG